MQQMPVYKKSPNAKSTKAFEEVVELLMNPNVNRELKKRGMAAFFSHIIAGVKNN